MSLRKILGDTQLGPAKGIAAAFAFGLAIFAMQPIASAADPLGVDDGTRTDLVDPRCDAGSGRSAGPGLQRLRTRTRSRPPMLLPMTTRPRWARLRLRTACRICSRPTWCSCRTGPRPASSRTSPTASTTCPASTRWLRPGSTSGLGTARNTACRSSPTSRCGCGTRSCYKQAGLDPEKGPTSLEEFAAHARAVAKLGNGVSRHLLGRQLRRLRGLHLDARSPGPMARRS